MSPTHHRISCLSHPISLVTLYSSNRAEIKRTITVPSLFPGSHDIHLTRLPTSILDGSVRVEVQTPAGVNATLKSVSHSLRRTFSRPSVGVGKTSPALREGEEKLAALKAKLEMFKKCVDTLGGYMAKMDPKDVSVASLKEGTEFYMERNGSMVEERRKTEKDIEEVVKLVERERERIREEEEEKQGGEDGWEDKNRTRSRVVVNVFVEKEKGFEGEIEMELHITYAVTNAWWSPLYEARVSTITEGDEPPAKLSYKAEITQATGEDWRDVSLHLSTSTPTLSSTKPPSLPSWSIKSYVPPAPVFASSMAKKKKGLGVGGSMRHRRIATAEVEAEASDDDMGYALFDDEYAPQTAAMKAEAMLVNKVGAGHASASFEIMGKTTVLSVRDGSGRKKKSGEEEDEDGEGQEKKTVTIVDLKLGASLEWLSVPRMAESVFLNARVRNTSDYQLLPGPSSVYLDGVFVASSSIPSVAPQEYFTINLGSDPSIRITYHPLSKRRATSGFRLVTAKTDTHSFVQRITVHNAKTQALSGGGLIIVDHIPVSEEDKIIVKLTQPSLPASAKSEDARKWVNAGTGLWARWAGVDEGGEQAEEDVSTATQKGEGKIEWRCELGAGKKATIVQEWEVTGPVGTKIEGLDKGR